MEEQAAYVCWNCGETFYDDDDFEIDGNQVCFDCFNDLSDLFADDSEE